MTERWPDESYGRPVPPRRPRGRVVSDHARAVHAAGDRIAERRIADDLDRNLSAIREQRESNREEDR